ncbi:hypothetical protein WN944_017554 [Citrus x changshan-huyou]|uniref:C2 domain-containing protein n=1 Tax=Citrus x changshan-huyou TaxID=2935761 RepID=A0AAP0MBH2_9ROSI
MKGGILEVLLVNAEGIKHTNIFGTPSYYVIAQCGNQEHRSKNSMVKGEKAWWNEKFIFEFPMSDWKLLTHIKFRIMDTELLTDGGFVGETTYYLGGIITDQINDKELIEVKPAPYNVLLEDDTYKGQIVIGFKFIVNREVRTESEGGEFVGQEINNNAPRQHICRCILNLWKMSWFRFLFRCLLHLTVSEIASHKIVHATSKGLSVIKEIGLEAALRLGIGGL